MPQRIDRNRLFLRDLFAGEFRGHALIMDAPPLEAPHAGDLACSDAPLGDWVDWALRAYERSQDWSDRLADDHVPYVITRTGTEILAAAFGCNVHLYPSDPPSARPLVYTAAEADALRVPSLDVPILARVLEFARQVRRRVGADVPVSVPDIQSPFDVAALIWNKEDFFVALYEAPQAVHRLVDKCRLLLESILDELVRVSGPINFCHCPHAWAPPELGMWLSEDEVGSLSVAMFEEFSLPVLQQLSRKYGGMFIHCCATADHQYASLRKIPNLRGLNRVFQQPGPLPAFHAFDERTVFMVAWCDLTGVMRMLDSALPTTRFLFNLPWMAEEDARRCLEALRRRCPRK